MKRDYANSKITTVKFFRL